MPHARLASDAAAFYLSQSAASDPGALADRYADLPADPLGLARSARDLTIHRVEGDLSTTRSPPTGSTTTPRHATSKRSCARSSSETVRR